MDGFDYWFLQPDNCNRQNTGSCVSGGGGVDTTSIKYGSSASEISTGAGLMTNQRQRFLLQKIRNRVYFTVRWTGGLDIS